MNLKPIGQNIIVKLPDYQKERERKTNGIDIIHLEGQFQHEATHGTVVAVGDEVTEIQVGDEVFFTHMCIAQGKQNMGRDKCANEETRSYVPVYYLEESDAHYLVMPYKKIVEILEDISGVWENPLFSGVILLIRGNNVICCNNYYTMEAAYDNGEVVEGIRAKKTESGLFIAKLHAEPEKEKFYRITNAPENGSAQKGDIVYTVPHSDIPLEGYFNFPLLPKGTYYLEENQILLVKEVLQVA